MQRANSPYKKIVKWCSKLNVCSIPKNKTETVPEVTKMICRTKQLSTLALANGRRRLNLAYSVQVLTIKQQRLAIDHFSFRFFYLQIWNSSSTRIEAMSSHTLAINGVVCYFHEYGFQVEQIITDEYVINYSEQNALHKLFRRTSYLTRRGTMNAQIALRERKKSFSSTFFCICFTHLNINFIFIYWSRRICLKLEQYGKKKLTLFKHCSFSTGHRINSFLSSRTFLDKNKWKKVLHDVSMTPCHHFQGRGNEKGINCHQARKKGGRDYPSAI